MTWNTNDPGNTPPPPPPPGGFGGPPPPPGMPGPGGAQPPVGPPSATSTFGDAWETFKRSWVPPTVVMLVLTIVPFIMLVPMAISAIKVAKDPSFQYLTTTQQNAKIEAAAASPPLLLGLIFLLAVASIISNFALYRAGLLATSGQQVTFGNMLSNIAWGPAIGGSIVAGIALYIGLLLCAIPGILLAGMFMVLTPALVDGRGFGGAFAHSWEFGKKNFGYVMALVGFMFLVSLVASFCFIVAIPATYLIALLSVCAYRASEGKAIINA